MPGIKSYNREITLTFCRNLAKILDLNLGLGYMIKAEDFMQK